MDENETTERETDNLATQMTRTFALNLASSAGIIGGMALVGTVTRVVRNRIESRTAKETTETKVA